MSVGMWVWHGERGFPVLITSQDEQGIHWITCDSDQNVIVGCEADDSMLFYIQTEYLPY